MVAAKPAAKPAADGSGKLGRGWEVNMGVVAFGNKGVALRPQCLFGVQAGNFSAEAGVHDVRNGIKVSAQAEMAMSAEATGRCLGELHDSVELDTPGFREALDLAKQYLSGKSDQLAGLAEVLGVSRGRLESVLTGQVGAAQAAPMTLRVTVEVGLGMSAHVCLGWKDAQGFNMVGACGKATAALSLSVGAFAGRHRGRRLAKILLDISNFKFEYTFPIGSLEGQCPACEGSGMAKASCCGIGRRCPTCRGLGELPDAPVPAAACEAGGGGANAGAAGKRL